MAFLPGNLAGAVNRSLDSLSGRKVHIAVGKSDPLVGDGNVETSLCRTLGGIINNTRISYSTEDLGRHNTGIEAPLKTVIRQLYTIAWINGDVQSNLRGLLEAYYEISDSNDN